LVKIVVFDSGLGSLSIIKPIQKHMKCSIVYFADSKNFPYGKKSIKEIKSITLQTISILQKLFEPDLIIIGSNTLSLTLDSYPKNVIPVLPPFLEAIKLTQSKTIAILATESIVKSNLLDDHVKNLKTNNIKIIKINISPLVELVELGKFYSDPELCKNIIKQTLSSKFLKNNVDVATLSSTHLPFLLKFLEKIFPNICFLNPSESLVKKLKQQYSVHHKQRNSIRILTSGNVETFERKLRHMRIKNKISKLTINE
jgi:glutamate racemase